MPLFHSYGMPLWRNIVLCGLVHVLLETVIISRADLHILSVLRSTNGRFDGHEFEQAPGVGDGQGSLVCCSPWFAESYMTEQLN